MSQWNFLQANIFLSPKGNLDFKQSSLPTRGRMNGKCHEEHQQSGFSHNPWEEKLFEQIDYENVSEI